VKNADDRPGMGDVAGFGAGTVGGRVVCGDVDIRIDRDGVWYYHGSPIGRKELVCLFSSVLRREADGSYWLVTPAEAARIRVDDAPFLAVELFACKSGRNQVLSVRTNVDEVVTLDARHPLRVETDPASGEPSPYVLVRDGLEARLSRSVYYDLVARGVEEIIDREHIYGIWSSGTFFPLGRLDDGG
jgi:hypothetical protein